MTIVDVEATARAMTPKGQREHLLAAGWWESCRWTPPGVKRKPERWYHPRNRETHYTLGQAIRACLAEELLGAGR